MEKYIQRGRIVDAAKQITRTTLVVGTLAGCATNLDGCDDVERHITIQKNKEVECLKEQYYNHTRHFGEIDTVCVFPTPPSTEHGAKSSETPKPHSEQTHVTEKKVYKVNKFELKNFQKSNNNPYIIKNEAYTINTTIVQEQSGISSTRNENPSLTSNTDISPKAYNSESPNK